VTPAIDIALATATQMPRADAESALVIDALSTLGLSARLFPWDVPVDWAAIPLVVCRSPWDYFHRPAEFLSWAGEVAATTRFENPIDVVKWNSHKSYLLDLERAGVPVVPTLVVPVGSDDVVRARALARYPSEVVIKPAVAGGALGALRTDAAGDAARDHLDGLSRHGDVLVQPFVPSVARDGESSLVFFDGRYSHAVRKLPAGGDFRVQEFYGGSVHDHLPGRDELAVAEAALAASPAPTAYARIDLVTGEDGPMVMEAELIEPELFLPMAPGSAARFAATLAGRLAAEG